MPSALPADEESVDVDRAPSRARSMAGRMLLLVLFVAGMFLLHGDFLRRGFFQDDFIFEARFAHASTVDVLRCFTPSGIDWFYRPVFIVWFALFTRFWPHNPVPLHAGSLVLAGIDVFLLTTFTARLTRNRWIGLLSGLLLFLAGNVDEAVWWVSSSATLIAAGFALAALHLWMSMRETGDRRFYGGALLATILAMCSKEDVATLPLALFVFDTYLKRVAELPSMSTRIVRDYLPLLLWTAIYGVLDIAAYRHYAAHSVAGSVWHGVHGIRPEVIASFMVQNLVYAPFGDPMSTSPSPLFVLPIVLTALVYRVRRNPLCLTGTALFVLFALPVPLASGGHVFSGRFNYVPTVFAASLLASAVWSALRSTAKSTRMVARALCVGLLLRHLPTVLTDVMTEWIVTAVVAVLTLWAAWRLPSIRRDAVLSISTTAAFFGQTLMWDDTWKWPVLAAVGALSTASLRRLEAVLDGVIAISVLTPSLPYSSVLFIAAAVVAAVRAKRPAALTLTPSP